MAFNVNSTKVCVIGLGYVGLPLAVEFAKKVKTVGFDINSSRVAELKRGYDRTLEVDNANLSSVLNSAGEFGLHITESGDEIADCNVYIVTVPTPIDKFANPDLTPLEKASASVGRYLKKGDYVIFESTVYPGATEEVCVPILESASGLTFNEDFYVGYSPERINPGDKKHTLTNITKVTSGSTPEAATFIDELYQLIITAGTHKVSQIRVAEAAKVIENSQRDINIAFVNELAKIFNLIGIDTEEVLTAAGTKWNFLPFRPGLVGGHCIGVDPYYLAQKAQELGYHPEIILSGRRLNDGMGRYVSTEIVKRMMKKNIPVLGAKALILGIAFKENCPDVRNTRVIDIYNELKGFDVDIDVYDPWVDKAEVKHEFGIDLLETEDIQSRIKDYEVVILAVGHNEFQGIEVSTSNEVVIYDVKSFWSKDKVDARL